MSTTSSRKSGFSVARAEKSSTVAGPTSRRGETDATSSPPLPVIQWHGASKCVPVCSPVRKLFSTTPDPGRHNC
jgi:hypothetical protein